MTEPIHDVNHWLETNGIKRRWADTVVSQIKKEYPHLGQAMKHAKSNRADLDLVLLVHHILQGRFPLTSAERTDGPSV